MASNRYEEIFEVNAHMTDADGICRASEVLRLLQEAANRQLEHRGPTEADLRAQGRAFLLSRISVSILRPLRAYEKVVTASWPCPSSRGFSFDRNYALDLLAPDGSRTPAACAVSQWALIGTADKKLLRVEDGGVDYVHDEAVSAALPLRFRIPRDAVLTEVGRKEILYSDADKNRHMNNTHYPDLYCDRLPMEGRRVSAFSVAFLSEAPLGDVLSVERTASPDADGVYYFRTRRLSDGAVNTEAMVKLTEPERG